jgi:hypothetical protein
MQNMMGCVVCKVVAARVHLEQATLLDQAVAAGDAVDLHNGLIHCHYLLVGQQGQHRLWESSLMLQVLMRVSCVGRFCVYAING